jgi:hypothetical protein
MCTHHACYHDESAAPAAVDKAATAVVDLAVGQENERPKTNREPLSPMQDMPPPPSASLVGLGHMDMNPGMGPPFTGNTFHASFHMGTDAGRVAGDHDAMPMAGQEESPLPDTLSWDNWLASQSPDSNASLPSIPQQCLMPTTGPPSTSASSHVRYLKPFAGRGLHTLESGSPTKQRMPVADQDQHQAVTHPATSAERDERQLATPGPAVSQGGSLPTEPNTPDRKLLSKAQRESRTAMVLAGPSRESFQGLSNTVQSHEERLDKLETASFSFAGHDDCSDRHDGIDVRVSELESRIDEFEKILSHDAGSVAGSLRLHRPRMIEDAASSVTGSATTSSDRAEMYTQLLALQAQVNHLKASSLPSYTQPMELEVVFLPFPLKGLWMDAAEFAAAQRQTQFRPGEGWTQLPNTHSRATPDPSSPYTSEWIPYGREADWLQPRACAPGRLIDQRLKSRGLIRTVSIRGPDARSVQLAIDAAFGNAVAGRSVFAFGSSLPQHLSKGIDSRLTHCLGLRHAWIPLRKLHKDSRLRFLTPAEMTTPTLWDVAFLTSSVVMKAAGTQRLYVTQPEAYLQDHPVGLKAFEQGWTWHKLRELSRVYPDSQETKSNASQSQSGAEVPEADALEEYWAWNEKLDEAPGMRRAVPPGLRQTVSSMRRSSSPSQQFYSGLESPILSSSPRGVRAQSPLMSRQRQVVRPPHIRTTSLPPVQPVAASPALSKRRIASYATAPQMTQSPRHTSPLMTRPSPRLQSPRLSIPPRSAPIIQAPTSAAKSRRSTRSPSLRPRNTPRWSNRSFSRSPSVVPGPAGGHAGPPYAGDGERAGERRTTPFYYATPYSNAPAEPPNTRATSRIPGAREIDNDDDGGYGYDGYEEGDDDLDMDDRGSMTDPEDSQMTGDIYDDGNDADNDADYDPDRHALSNRRDNDDDDADEDPDIDVYEDEDSLDGVGIDTGMDASRMVRSPSGAMTYGQAGGRQLLPEDEPWPGIEDHMSDGENVEPGLEPGMESQGSGASSQPSEYPSTQNAWAGQEGDGHERGAVGDRRGVGVGDEEGFMIHEDGQEDVNGPRGTTSQWP